MSNIPKGLYRAFEDIFFWLNPYFCGKSGIGYYADNGLLRLTPFPSARRGGPCKTCNTQEPRIVANLVIYTLLCKQAYRIV